MRITLLGTGFAIPFKDRVQSSVLIDTEGELILLDCGAGVLSRLSQSRYDYINIDHVFFTHLHLDHNSDFLALLKADFLRDRNHLNVYGPVGTKDWIGNLFDAYPYLKGRFDLNIKELGGGDVVKIGDVVVSCENMDHVLPTIGYRIESKSGSVVYTGDTVPCEGVKRLCKRGLNVLIHECAFPDPVEGEPVEGHTTPSTLGNLIGGMDIDKIVITHFAPESEGKQDTMVESLKMFFKGDVIAAYDLLEFEV